MVPNAVGDRIFSIDCLLLSRSHSLKNMRKKSAAEKMYNHPAFLLDCEFCLSVRLNNLLEKRMHLCYTTQCQSLISGRHLLRITL